MSWNTLFFGVFPYIALTLAVAVTAYRMVYRPFSVSAQSSQLLEQKRLFFGSTAMHWGLVIVLLGHLLALLLPKGLFLWNAVPIRLYLLEITGLGLGLWASWAPTSSSPGASPWPGYGRPPPPWTTRS